LRTIIRFVLVLAGLACVLDGMLNAYRNALGPSTETIFIPLRGPFVRMAVGVVLIALGLIFSGLLGRLAAARGGEEARQ
jgi:hypothetical protein